MTTPLQQLSQALDVHRQALAGLESALKEYEETLPGELPGEAYGHAETVVEAGGEQEVPGHNNDRRQGQGGQPPGGREGVVLHYRKQVGKEVGEQRDRLGP